jgi:hypothetical protein
VLSRACLIAAGIVLQSPAKPQPPGVDSLHPEVSRADIESIVRYLASDELLGRSTGTPEAERAAAYLVDVLKHCGVEPAGDDGTFLQAVPLHRTEATGTPELALVARSGAGAEEKIQAVLGRDFDLSGPPIDVDGMKVIVAKSAEEIPKAGAPGSAIFVDAFEMDARSWLVQAGHPFGQGFGMWIRAGPKAEGKPKTAEIGSVGGLERDSGPRSTTPSVKIRGPLLERVRKGEIQSVSVHAHVELRKVRAFNVVGRISGVGLPGEPDLAKEAVVVSAHYDHLPPKPAPKPPEKAGDLIYNGADDDASGCAAVLEIAGALGAGAKPARTVIFLLATGEEEGLLGTDVYIDHPVVPLEKTVANLNVEMIGRPDPLVGGTGQVWLTGFDETDLGRACAEAGLPVKPDPRLDQHFYERSDNYAFVQRQVIGQTFSTYNMHEDYHHTSDEADRIDFAHMEGCTSAILKAVRLVVDGKLRPHWAMAR